MISAYSASYAGSSLAIPPAWSSLGIQPACQLVSSRRRYPVADRPLDIHASTYICTYRKTESERKRERERARERESGRGGGRAEEESQEGVCRSPFWLKLSHLICVPLTPLPRKGSQSRLHQHPGD